MQLLLTQSLAPPFDSMGGVVASPPALDGIKALTINHIIMQIVVKTQTIVMPFSFENAIRLSSRIVSSSKTVYCYVYYIFVTALRSFVFTSSFKTCSLLIF